MKKFRAVKVSSVVEVRAVALELLGEESFGEVRGEVEADVVGITLCDADVLEGRAVA